VLVAQATAITLHRTCSNCQDNLLNLLGERKR
jgi:hypothetical protein